jgi:RuvB-like protein 2
MAVSAELGGSSVPFTQVAASTVYSVSISKTEALRQAVRQSVNVQIQEETELLHGEVVELSIETAATGKSGRLTLATTDMETIYDLGTKMIAQIQNEKIQAGDVVTIDKASGKIKKLGRSFSKSRDYDAVSATTKFVATPEGEILQRKTVTHTVSLHEMDVINSRQQGFLALFAGDTGEIRQEVRQQVDEKVQEWKEEGRCTLIPGVLFLDEVHMLDLECFSFLNRAMESDLAPVMIFATNKAVSRIRGTEYTSPHGIPMDLLDRLLIIPTEKYNDYELKRILQVRATEEQVDVNEDALELLTRIASTSSLRYAMQLIAVSYVAAKKQKRNVIELRDVQRCSKLFVDVERSTARLLGDDRDTFLFNQVASSSSGGRSSTGNTVVAASQLPVQVDVAMAEG